MTAFGRTDGDGFSLCTMKHFFFLNGPFFGITSPFYCLSLGKKVRASLLGQKKSLIFRFRGWSMQNINW